MGHQFFIVWTFILNIMHKTLSPQQIQSFITDGFVRINNAFSADLANEARNILWKDIPANPSDSTTWTRPVVWLGMYSQEPFVEAANMEISEIVFSPFQTKVSTSTLPHSCRSVWNFHYPYSVRSDRSN